MTKLHCFFISSESFQTTFVTGKFYVVLTPGLVWNHSTDNVSEHVVWNEYHALLSVALHGSGIFIQFLKVVLEPSCCFSLWHNTQGFALSTQWTALSTRSLWCGSDGLMDIHDVEKHLENDFKVNNYTIRTRNRTRNLWMVSRRFRYNTETIRYTTEAVQLLVRSSSLKTGLRTYYTPTEYLWKVTWN